MNTEHFNQWIAALRSGEYEQGRTLLHRKGSDIGEGDGLDRFCCLGVVCVLSGIPKKENKHDYTYGVDQPGVIVPTSPTGLPYLAAVWLGVPPCGNLDVDLLTTVTDRSGYGYSLDAMSMNDDLRLTFPQIADMFEYFGIKEDA